MEKILGLKKFVKWSFQNWWFSLDSTNEGEETSCVLSVTLDSKFQKNIFKNFLFIHFFVSVLIVYCMLVSMAICQDDKMEKAAQENTGTRLSKPAQPGQFGLLTPWTSDEAMKSYAPIDRHPLGSAARRKEVCEILWVVLKSLTFRETFLFQKKSCSGLNSYCGASLTCCGGLSCTYLVPFSSARQCARNWMSINRHISCQ